MCQGGEGKRERVIEVQNDIGAKPLRKNKILHSDAAMGETQKGKNNRPTKRVKLLTGD